MSVLEVLHREHVQRRARFMAASMKLKPAPLPEPKTAPVEQEQEIPWNKLAKPKFVAPAPLDRDVLKTAVPLSDTYPSIQTIQWVICTSYGIRRADLISERRTANIVLPRQIAIYLAKQLTPRSLPAIGRAFGGRDHTTVLHAIRKIEALLPQDETLRNRVNDIMGAFRPAGGTAEGNDAS